MFVRFTERARRVIFFARYHAAQLGSRTIESEHLLLGLMQEDKNLTNLRLPQSEQSVREDIIARLTIYPKTSTSTDLPLSNESKRILAYTAEEADRMNHRHIGTEHLLLGILREEHSLAARVLTERGLRLEAIRDDLERTIQDRQTRAGPPDAWFSKSGAVPDADTAIRIAEAIWRPIYGQVAVEKQKPYNAELKDGFVWIVTGTLPASEEAPLSAHIRKDDGRVIAIEPEQRL